MRVVVAFLLLISFGTALDVRLSPRAAVTPIALDVWDSGGESLEWANSLVPNTQARSYSAWLYFASYAPGDPSFPGIFRKGETESTGHYERTPGIWSRPTTNQLHVRSATTAPEGTGENTGVDTVFDFPAGEWHHWAFTHGSGFLTNYIDGSLDQAPLAVTAPFNNTATVKSGGAQYNPGNYGIYVYDLRYFDYDLSATEVSDLYDSYSRFSPNGWYPHDGDIRAMSHSTVAYNPTGDHIHTAEGFEETMAFKTSTGYGVSVTQGITDIVGDGLTFEFNIWFYDTTTQPHDWVGLGPNGATGYNVNHVIGFPNSVVPNYGYYDPTTNWQQSSVARTVGWHKFTFSRAGSGQPTLYFVDDVQIASSTHQTTTAVNAVTIRHMDAGTGWWSPFFSTDREIDVSPTSLDFGQQNQLDGATAAQTVTISNLGSEPLVVSAVALSGTHTADFAVSGVPTLPHSIVGGGTLELDVTFDPSAEGARSASLDITSNDADEGSVSVTLAGQGGSGNQLLCEVSTATDPPTRFYRSSASDTCQASPTTANSCYYPEDKLATTFPTELRIVGPNAQAPLFADPVSRLANDGTDDRIYVAFNLPTKYYNHELVFADATNCGTWTLSAGFPTANTASLDNCYLTYEWSQVWADAYASDGSKCGWNRTVDGSNVELTLDFGIFAVEDVGDVRGESITRNVTFAHPMTVEFPTQVTAETSNIQVFSPVRTLAAVVGQSVTVDESTDPDTATLTVTLSTEVQAPFELHAITSNTVAPGITLVTTLNGANDENVRQEAECTNGALDCANTWQIQYSTQTTTTPCNFNGGYSVDFTIRCSDESDTNCPIDDATDSVTVSFTLASSDHCPTVIDSIVLNAELKVYDAPQRVTDADDFVGDGLQDDGQTAVNEGDADQWQVAYFTAPTTSSQVAILETEFNQVWVERGAAADVTLLDKDNSLGGGAVTCTATAYADADDTASCGTEAGLDSTTCQLVVPDVAFPDKCGAFDFAHRKGTAAAAGENSIPWFEFDINTGASGFNLANDAIETMTVHAVIDVSYANAAKMVAGAQSTTRRQHADVSASISAGQTGTAASSSSSSATLFGMNAMVVYAGAAVVAIVAVAAIVVSSRRRGGEAKMTKIQSTAELTTTSASV